MTYLIDSDCILSIVQEPDCPLTTIECLEYDAIDKPVNEIKEALEKAEKYKWHDLRKNPDDLPTTHGMKLVYIDTHGWGHAYDTDVFVKGEFNMFSRYTDSVLCWREIEAFEEEGI